MKEILIRLLVAACLTLAAFALSSSARGLQADSPSDARRSSTSAVQTAATSPSGADETQEALVFTGQIAQARRVLVLMDPVTKMTYQLDDQVRATRFVGRQVKVIGRLGMKSNTIHIDTITATR